jgi:ubiquitin-conjugating enzyme E2 D/E
VGSIVGPEGTPYAGGKFELDIKIPVDYPFKPPEVTFRTKVYHPNISLNGTVSVDILRGAWSPMLRIPKILLSLSSLLSDPNPDDALNCDAARLYKSNKRLFEQTAREWTRRA